MVWTITRFFFEKMVQGNLYYMQYSHLVSYDDLIDWSVQ